MVSTRVSVGIAPDDLQVGDFVAVVEAVVKQRPKMVMGRDVDGDPMLIQMQEDSVSQSAGVPHRVLGISWPWAVFGILLPGGEVDGPVILDLRKVKCMRLEDQYIEAIRSFVKPAQLDQGGDQTKSPVDKEAPSIRF